MSETKYDALCALNVENRLAFDQYRSQGNHFLLRLRQHLVAFLGCSDDHVTFPLTKEAVGPRVGIRGIETIYEDGEPQYVLSKTPANDYSPNIDDDGYWVFGIVVILDKPWPVLLWARWRFRLNDAEADLQICTEKPESFSISIEDQKQYIPAMEYLYNHLTKFLSKGPKDLLMGRALSEPIGFQITASPRPHHNNISSS
jgi:hypothetical protein